MKLKRGFMPSGQDQAYSTAPTACNRLAS